MNTDTWIKINTTGGSFSSGKVVLPLRLGGGKVASKKKFDGSKVVLPCSWLPVMGKFEERQGNVYYLPEPTLLEITVKHIHGNEEKIIEGQAIEIWAGDHLSFATHTQQIEIYIEMEEQATGEVIAERSIADINQYANPARKTDILPPISWEASINKKAARLVITFFTSVRLIGNSISSPLRCAQ